MTNDLKSFYFPTENTIKCLSTDGGKIKVLSDEIIST